MRHWGVSRRLYTAGERKGALDPFSPENPEEVERIKAIQRDIHENFQAWVRVRRGDRLRDPDGELFTGEFWSGKRALELGLVDGLDDLRASMRRRFGDDVRLRPVGTEVSRWRRLLPWPVGRAEDGAGWAEDLIGAAEARWLWSRFGL